MRLNLLLRKNTRIQNHKNTNTKYRNNKVNDLTFFKTHGNSNLNLPNQRKMLNLLLQQDWFQLHKGGIESYFPLKNELSTSQQQQRQWCNLLPRAAFRGKMKFSFPANATQPETCCRSIFRPTNRQTHNTRSLARNSGCVLAREAGGRIFQEET